MTKDIMDVKEVAAYLGFSPTTIYRMLTSSEIPNVKVGGQYRFPKTVIDDWIAGKLELPDGKAERREGGKKANRPEQKQTPKPKTKPVVRVEDEIVGHLRAALAEGSKDERNRAKQIMLAQIDKMDWSYLATKAEKASVLQEAISVQKELITEAAR